MNLPEEQGDSWPIKGLGVPEIASSYLKSNVPLPDWAEDHQELEYRLWLGTRNENSSLQEEAQSRLRNTERALLLLKIEAAFFSFLGAGVLSGAADLAIAEGKPSTAIPMAAFAGLCVIGVRKIFKYDLPWFRQRVATERANYNSFFGQDSL